MPAPVLITIKNKVYTTPVLSGEMGEISNQITQTKESIRELQNSLADKLNTLQNLNNQFMAMYIQQTGSFPE
jgi:peptidoglycan hydrolase CwlO-like protein